MFSRSLFWSLKCSTMAKITMQVVYMTLFYVFKPSIHPKQGPGQSLYVIFRNKMRLRKSKWYYSLKPRRGGPEGTIWDMDPCDCCSLPTAAPSDGATAPCKGSWRTGTERRRWVGWRGAATAADWCRRRRTAPPSRTAPWRTPPDPPAGPPEPDISAYAARGQNSGQKRTLTQTRTTANKPVTGPVETLQTRPERHITGSSGVLEDEPQ